MVPLKEAKNNYRKLETKRQQEAFGNIKALQSGNIAAKGCSKIPGLSRNDQPSALLPLFQLCFLSKSRHGRVTGWLVVSTHLNNITVVNRLNHPKYTPKISQKLTWTLTIDNGP